MKISLRTNPKFNNTIDNLYDKQCESSFCDLCKDILKPNKFNLTHLFNSFFPNCFDYSYIIITFNGLRTVRYRILQYKLNTFNTIRTYYLSSVHSDCSFICMYIFCNRGIVHSTKDYIDSKKEYFTDKTPHRHLYFPDARHIRHCTVPISPA